MGKKTLTKLYLAPFYFKNVEIQQLYKIRIGIVHKQRTFVGYKEKWAMTFFDSVLT